LEKGVQYRDIIMGQEIVRQITATKNNTAEKRKKHLIIMNHPHAYLTTKKSASGWVKESFPEQTVNIYIGTSTKNGEKLIENGKWDAAFKYANLTNVGFDLHNTPFGQTKMASFTLNPNQKNSIQDFYHGFVFYKPVEEHVIAYGYPNFIDDVFRKELRRRNRIRNPFKSYKKGNWEQYNTVEKTKYENIESLVSQRENWSFPINNDSITSTP